MAEDFKRLTYDEAVTLTRGDLLERIVAEQQHWFGWRSRQEPAAFAEFCRIVRLLDPGEAVADCRRLAEGVPGGSYWDEKAAQSLREEPAASPSVASLLITTGGLDIVHAVVVCPHGSLADLTCCGEYIFGWRVADDPDCPECVRVLSERLAVADGR